MFYSIHLYSTSGERNEKRDAYHMCWEYSNFFYQFIPLVSLTNLQLQLFCTSKRSFVSHKLSDGDKQAASQTRAKQSIRMLLTIKSKFLIYKYSELTNIR